MVVEVETLHSGEVVESDHLLNRLHVMLMEGFALMELPWLHSVTYS